MNREKITHERRHIRLRIEILDELLGSPRRRTYKELLQALGNTLELNGEVPIKERMLKNDISFLINNEGAPIHRPTKKDPLVYYTEKFSLKRVPVDDDDIAYLKQAVAILKKATDIKLTSEIDAIISKLENKIHTNVPESNTMIAFEEHTQANGNEYFDRIFSAIQEKCPIKILYQPFGKNEREWVIHPYMLKEYRNRWFLIARIGDNPVISNVGLDRIKGAIRNCSDPFIENDLFDSETYFTNLIGVTIPLDQKEPSDIQIKVSSSQIDYIKTKPLHRGQKIIKEYKNGSILISLNLFNNYELKSYLLSYGPGIEVIKPKVLREEMKALFQTCNNLYKL